MSSKTPNVDLYKADKVTDADQTFNIDTMLNENWDKVDAAIGEMRTEIGEIEPEIPDASTTQKGIVQLDDTTSSTSKGKAATADAVRRAKDEAIWAAVGVKDTRNVNAAPNTYTQGVTREFKIGASIGLDGQTHVLLETYKPWVDVSGGVIHQIGFGGTTGTLYRRTGTTDGTGWNGWVEQIHSGYPWQKHKLSEQNGASINVSGQNLNDLVATGFYDGQSLGNAPINTTSEWWYIQVQRHSNSDQYVIQTARTLSSNSGLLNTYYQRIRTNGVWQAWTQDLFQSVANGKASLKTAISGKGSTISQAGSTPTFAELINGVNNISRGSNVTLASTSGITDNGSGLYASKSVEKEIMNFSAESRAVLVARTVASGGNAVVYTDWTAQVYQDTSSNGTSYGYVGYRLKDSNGNIMNLCSTSSTRGYTNIIYIHSIVLDIAAKIVTINYQYWSNYSNNTSFSSSTLSFPSGFVSGSIKLMAYVDYSVNSGAYAYYSSYVYPNLTASITY